MEAVDHRRPIGNSAPAPIKAFARIVVLDGATLDPGDNPWDQVAAFGPLEVYPRTAPAQVRERALGADLVLTNKTVLDADFFAAMPGLRLVVVLATGVNVVDLEAAARHGVTVCNVPGYSADSVPQHVFALVLEGTNAVAEHAAAVREGRWASSPDFSFCTRPLTELAGLTMGIVGHGRIGARVGELAHAFGMKVLAYSPSRKVAGDYGGFGWASVEEIFARADVVSLHCPLTGSNRRFVDAALLATMRESSLLVNTARGDLVDEAALAVALDAGRPGAAALDVLSVEPPPADHPLVAHPRCLITPHVAWATLAARRRLMAITAENIRAFAAGSPIHVVGPSGTTTSQT
ncbi:MAG: D-2-hydroxyacid dehydrogenase [Candidatus Binatia bacterium]